jgi:hypothetical protein
MEKAMLQAFLLISTVQLAREGDNSRSTFCFRSQVADKTQRTYFFPSCEPFAMTVAGQTIYVATAANDINNVWKNSKTISMKPITMDMYILGGISEKSRKAMFKQHPTARYHADQGRDLTPTQMVIDLHQQQLHTGGPELESLLKGKTIPSCFKNLDIADPANQAVLSHSGDSAVVSLLSLCVNTFITDETESYFGPTLLQRSPNLVKAFLDWEYCNWKFLFMLPEAFAQDMVKAKSTITGAFADYYQQQRSKRPGSIYFVDALEDMLREVGLNEDEMGKFTLLHYWA